MIRNVILDWSGTVVDDLRPVVKATNASLVEHGYPEISLEEFRAEFCLPMVPFYEKRMAGHTMEVINESYHRNFVKFAEQVEPLPNSPEFLEFCRSTGRRLFVLSTISPSHYEHQSRKFGLEHFFEEACTGVIDKRERIGQLIEQHGLRKEETLFAGDMVHDVETARHAGVLSVAVLSGFNDLAKLAQASPDVVVRDLGDLRILMEGWGTKKSSGIIRIDGLEIDVRVGVPDDEIAHPQRLLIDLHIGGQRSFSDLDENIAQTVDYFAVCETVRAFAAAGKWRLIETLALDLKELVETLPNVAWAKIKVRKFILPYTEQVSVEI